MKITVIGGGAAGMMCAALAAENKQNKVTLIERNKILGIKLNITGKGRCNLTNDTDEDGLLKNTVTNGRFLYSAYSAFTPADVKEYFEKLGVPLKTERGDRVFPQSDRAKDISGALITKLKRSGVNIVQARALEILTDEGAVKGVNRRRHII